jgi:hypothetical protein
LAFRKAQLVSAIALGVGAAISAVPAHADELSDLKALIKELKSEVVEQRAQVKDLKTQINSLNVQVTDQKKQVSDQSAQVQSQISTLQKVEAQQQSLEEKQAATSAFFAGDPDNPGFFAIPGTKTSLKIGGYVKLDVVDDVQGNIGTSAASKTATDFTSVPMDRSQAAHRDGQVNFTAQESRLNLTALTKSESLGEVKTVVEGDFYNFGGTGNLFRLRHAYVSGGSYLAGQTWSTFMDLDTAGTETLDFNGPVGYAFIRQPQLRYTAKLPTGDLALALESPSGDISTNTTDNHLDKSPDIVARYTVDPSWGHIGVAGLGRYLASDSGLPGTHPNKLAFGVMGGLGVKTIGKDMLVFQTIDGNGVGRYLNQGQGYSAVLINGALKPINVWGGTVGYTHFWTDALRSSADYGLDHFSTPKGESITPIKLLNSVHANLIYSPWTDTDIGLEYIYGHLETSSPVLDAATRTSATKGDASRIEGSVKYTF